MCYKLKLDVDFNHIEVGKCDWKHKISKYGHIPGLHYSTSVMMFSDNHSIICTFCCNLWKLKRILCEGK